MELVLAWATFPGWHRYLRRAGFLACTATCSRNVETWTFTWSHSALAASIKPEMGLQPYPV